MRSGLEIQEALRAFVKKWRGYTGSERAEAQTFLNELFACYGSDRSAVGALFEDFTSSAGFMDLHWPGNLIVEMKAPGVALAKAQDQRRRYWQESSDAERDIPAARFVIACNFGQFEVWEPGRFPNEPRIVFTLDELPDRYDSLLFLQSERIEPVFAEHRRALTRDAADHIATLFTSLADRGAAPIDEIQRFAMQVVWCLFAEDLGMLDGYPLQATVNDLLSQAEPDSARDIGHLFRLLNQKGDHNRQGRYSGTRYVNGELFARPAEVFLDRSELVLLRAASEFDWRTVDPTIFGSLLEGVLGDERRERLGAHYTHEADIMKIVTPTIIRPWRERIEATTDAAHARVLLDELCRFRVLDPSCGSGNFLYVAYRELRALEFDLKQRVRSLAAAAGTPVPDLTDVYYPLANIMGIDIERVAVMIARVTLWMGHRQMVDRFGPAEPVLPLVDLSGIRAADALTTPWPRVDAIIGNPPFLGSQLIRKNLGDQYIAWLSSAFGVGVKDLCVYWFRKTHEALEPGQRAGLVGTNSIAQNRAREASLEYIVNGGGVITDAVSSQKWPGDAKVHVSIVNWVKSPASPPTEYSLDGAAVDHINSSLTAGVAAPAARLAANGGKSFQGPIPVGEGFVLDADTARALLADATVDYAPVVRPYLVGEDIANQVNQGPSRWIIDFATMPLEQAIKYPRALDIVRDRVKPMRDVMVHRARRERWWMFGANAVGMRSVLAPLARYAALGRVGKRALLAWQDSAVCPSDQTVVFAFDDDYSMGILLSRAHDAWAWSRSSTLETRLRYTPTSVFETFPWPDPVTPEQRAEVAAAASDLYARRSELCTEHGLGLTKLYNLMDDGGFRDLAALHKRLDAAVAKAYGWPAAVAQDPVELMRRLAERNQEIASGRRAYAPFD